MSKHRIYNKLRSVMSRVDVQTEGTRKPGTSFDSETYLNDHEDVRAAIEAGEFSDPYDHYARYGAEEGRQPITIESPIAGSVDALLFTRDGKIFLHGWVDDKYSLFERIELSIGYDIIAITKEHLYRYVRRDVENYLTVNPSEYPYAFFVVLDLERPLAPVPKSTVKIIGRSGTRVFTPKTEPLSISEFLSRFLAFYGTRETIGDITATSLGEWATGLKETVHGLWTQICEETTAGYDIAIVGKQPKQPKISFVIVSYKEPLFLAAQCALCFGQLPPDAYELVIACNSPEIIEKIYSELEIANILYGVTSKLICFSGNTGFSNANNIAAGLASGRRLILMNPDILPNSSDWMGAIEEAHEAAKSNDVIGAALYYGDGSLMHGGMDVKLEHFPPAPSAPDLHREALWVDHYWKGSPPAVLRDAVVRSVPAITGAFISVSRDFYYDVTGFSSDFVYAHYEDADFCLRVWEAGGRVVFDPRIRLFHFEGQGSGMGHVGASGMQLVNRCIFTERWMAKFETIRQAAHGPDTGELAIGVSLPASQVIQDVTK